MKFLRTIRPWIGLTASIALFFAAVKHLDTIPHQAVKKEILVALPRFAQVLLSAGDRYLAANIGSVRALVTDTAKMTSDEYAVMAQVQQDVSWLNVFHEDNYYSAAAILPWNGEVGAAQAVLRRASLARTYDHQPSLFYAFNQLHFYHDAIGASEWLRKAAPLLPNENYRLVMADLAARWVGKSDDLNVAIQLVKVMADEARRNDFREYLLKRVDRLTALKVLRDAANRYKEQFGHPPSRLSDLSRSGILINLPSDPFGEEFVINAKGIPVMRSELRK